MPGYVLTRSLLILALAAGGFVAPFARASTLANISTRARVETGNDVLIGGFIIAGPSNKALLVRALGQSLPVTGALSHPVLELHDTSGAVIGWNAGWRSEQESAIANTGAAPTDDREAAILAFLPPGNYTAIIRGADGAAGVALVETYDLDPPEAESRLANISTRGQVLVDDAVMIGGFIVRGDAPKKVLIRATGPSLALESGALANPMLELHGADGALLAANDHWRSDQEAELLASTLAPADDREPALVATLAPGNYTALVHGANKSTGLALVEIYDLDQPAASSDGSALYLAQLRGQPGTNSGGSGTATLRLSADETSAVVSVQFSNLSGPITGMHIHGPAEPGQSGEILFDLDAASPQPYGTYLWVFAPTGTSSVADIVAAIKAGHTSFNIHTAAHPAGEITGSFNRSTAAQTAPVPTPAPPLAAGAPTATDASRFLTQATFGMTDELLAQVQRVGSTPFSTRNSIPPRLRLWLTSMLRRSRRLSYAETLESWWTAAVTAPDQLR